MIPEDNQMVIKSIDISELNQYISQEKDKQQAFYDFMYKQLMHQANEEATNPNHCSIYFAKFIKTQFTTFTIGKGFAIINKQCQSPLCYFYINFANPSKHHHNFLQLLTKTISNNQKFQCSCKNSQNNLWTDSNFIFDSSLTDFLQTKLTDKQLYSLKQIQITKGFGIYVRQKQVVDNTLNSIRLELISKSSQQDKTIVIKTRSILNQIHKQIQLSSLLSLNEGLKYVSQQTEPNSKTLISVCRLKQNQGTIFMLNISDKSYNFQKSQLLIEPTLQKKMITYYDSGNMTLFGLTLTGILYKCDFRYMYNMVKNTFKFQQIAALTKLPNQNSWDAQESKIIIVNSLIYIFASSNVTKTISLFKCQWNKINQVQAILPDKIKYRKGFNCVYVPKVHFNNCQAIIIYGGIIRQQNKFKLVQIIQINKEEIYSYIKISVTPKEAEEMNNINPTIAVFRNKLFIWGGKSTTGKEDKCRSNLIIVKLVENKVLIFQLVNQINKIYFSDWDNMGCTFIGNKITNHQDPQQNQLILIRSNKNKNKNIITGIIITENNNNPVIKIIKSKDIDN